ncbi:shikimate kinase [Novosphingobium barchaimii]|nr:shikimate kinase [Novosphingobium barchaimii]
MDTSPPRLSDQQIAELARRIDRPVVLVGMMGVGKSSVGRRVAGLLGWPFVDADDEIERSARMTIPEIFAAYGEDYFRDGERRVITRLLTEGAKHTVIATGGGAFCNAATRELILSRAITVWLDSDVDTLVERTARTDKRPLLRDGNPREILHRLREDRRPHYSLAPIHVISASGPHTQTVHRVLEGIAQWL